jgi:preprotein translocase subunit SecY
MQFDEAKLSALFVSALTGIGLTLFLNQALRDLGTVLMITVPVTLVMGAVLFLFASDNIKKGGDKPPKGE